MVEILLHRDGGGPFAPCKGASGQGNDVGPKAKARPGPDDYGRGGVGAKVTDANVAWTFNDEACGRPGWSSKREAACRALDTE